MNFRILKIRGTFKTKEKRKKNILLFHATYISADKRCSAGVLTDPAYIPMARKTVRNHFAPASQGPAHQQLIEQVVVVLNFSRYPKLAIGSASFILTVFTDSRLPTQFRVSMPCTRSKTEYIVLDFDPKIITN